jgi:hypothetical protein
VALLLYLALGLLLASIAYGCVRFLDPKRASKPRAIAFVLLFGLLAALHGQLGLAIPVILDLMLVLSATTLLVFTVFRLKPLHCVTVGAFYLAIRNLVMASLAGMPQGFWAALSGSAA